MLDTQDSKIDQKSTHVSKIDVLSSLKSEERFVSIGTRPIESDLPASFWDPIARKSSDVSWKGIPMQKGPFQVVITQALIQELKPKTIIEFGSFKGGSALWLSDIQSLSVTGGKVISIDIDFDNIDERAKNNPNIEFVQGDCHQVKKIFSPEQLANLAHPILLIEDAHINTVGILEHFHQFAFKVGDYFIVEDTNIDYNNSCYKVWKEQLEAQLCQDKLDNLNNKIVNLNKWLQGKEKMYVVDTKYVDPFGIKNGSKNWNSVLKKVT